MNRLANTIKRTRTNTQKSALGVIGESNAVAQFTVDPFNKSKEEEMKLMTGLDNNLFSAVASSPVGNTRTATAKSIRGNSIN